MRRVFLYAIAISLLLPSCSVISGNTHKVVRPKYHHSWFDHKKDKKVKRTKVVRMKS